MRACRTLICLFIGAAFLGAIPFISNPAASAPAVIPPAIHVTGRPGTPVALFNGKDLAGWTWHGQVASQKLSDVWSVREGVLHCTAVASNATGYMDTDKAYKNFLLTLEYRHVTAGNGGIFICINGPAKVFPDAVQIQGKFGNVGDLINQNTGMKKMTTDPARTKTANKDVLVECLAPPAGKTAEAPVGQWNTLLITLESGNLSVRNNGVLLNTASEIAPDSGKVGLQAEGAEMEFRKVELIPLE